MERWKANLQNLVFVDVETTGLSTVKDRIIEIGIVKIKGNKVVDKYNQLIDPGFKISPEITRITGITNRQLKKAIPFKDAAQDVLKFINSGVFVAHNAPFDYAFMENEFGRVDMPFAAPRLCTVELSRALFPGEQSHSLDAISSRFNIKISNRHRAYDDAMATWFFFQKAKDMFDDYALKLVFDRVYQPSPSRRVAKLSTAQLSLLG